MKAPRLRLGNLSRRLIRFAAICLSAVVLIPLFPIGVAVGDIASFSVFATNEIPINETLALSAGSYGESKVKKNANLILEGAPII